MQKTKITLLFLLFCLVPVAASASFNSAMDQYNKGHYIKAKKEMHRLAKENRPYAQFMLGKMFVRGKGIKKNYIRGYKWLALAEDNGIKAAGNLKDKIRKKMSSTQVYKAKSMVHDFKNRNHYSYNRKEYTDKKTVRLVQQKLRDRGYYRSSIDGRLGWLTQKAIRKYQENNWLNVNGKITPVLLTTLNNKHNWKNNGLFLWSLNSTSNSQQDYRLQNDIRELYWEAKRRNAADTWVIRRLEKLAAR